MKKFTILCIALLSLPVMGSSCEPTNSSLTQELKIQEEAQKKMIDSVPTPNVSTSQERKSVAKRIEIFSNENKISYIYLISFGKVVANYTVKGKVASLRSYLSPQEKLVDYKGQPCSAWDSGTTCYIIESPDIDGTYGENPSGIFFFTTDGIYIEWNGEYFVSDQPMKVSTPVELTRDIK